MIQEIFRLNNYLEKDYRLSYLRTKNDAEIDLVLSKGKKNILIEIKSKKKIDEIEVRKLARLTEAFGPHTKSFYLSRDHFPMEIEGVKCQLWSEFLKDFHRLD